MVCRVDLGVRYQAIRVMAITPNSSAPRDSRLVTDSPLRLIKSQGKVPSMRPMQVGSGKRAPSFDEGSLDQYLREISKYPLIPQEEEVSLAQRIRVGDGEALDKLVRSNLRFVVSVAKKYQNQGVSLADLINEGNLGLIRAAHKFDETKGIKFISYAVWWIR